MAIPKYEIIGMHYFTDIHEWLKSQSPLKDGYWLLVDVGECGAVQLLLQVNAPYARDDIKKIVKHVSACPVSAEHAEWYNSFGDCALYHRIGAMPYSTYASLRKHMVHYKGHCPVKETIGAFATKFDYGSDSISAMLVAATMSKY